MLSINTGLAPALKTTNNIKKYHNPNENIVTLYDDGFIQIIRILNLLERTNKFIFKKGAQEIGVYDKVGNIITLNSQDKVIPVKNGNKSMYIRLLSGKNVGGEFDDIGKIENGYLNDQVFFAKQGDKEMYISFSSRLPIGGKFDKILKISIVNGNKVFLVKNNNKYFYIDIKTGNSIGGEFDDIGGLERFNDIVIFKGKKRIKRMYIDIKTGNSIGGEFDRISTIYKDEITGELYFIAVLKDKKIKINIDRGKNATTFKERVFAILNFKII